MDIRNKINEMLTTGLLDSEYAASVPKDNLLYVYTLLLAYKDQIENFVDDLEDRMAEEGF